MTGSAVAKTKKTHLALIKEAGSHFSRKYSAYKYFYLMLIPVIIYYIIFHYGPMYGIIIAFKDFSFHKGIWGSDWIGLANFKQMLSDPYFPNAFKNTVIISMLNLIFGFPAPIILALMLNEIGHLRFKKVVQTITYMPHFLSWVILAGVLKEFLSPSRGPVNIILMEMGMKPIFFLAEPLLFKPMLIATNIWKEVGFASIIYLAAIAGINSELYEAADVDGISRIKKMFYITIPSIAPAIVVMLILRAGSLISDDFEQVFNLINAKTMKVGDVISTYTYQMGLFNMQYSFGAAVGLFKNVVSLILVLTANYMASKVSDDRVF